MSSYNKNNQIDINTLDKIIKQKTSYRSELLLWMILVVFVTLMIWASYATVDEISRGKGKVIPSLRTQVVQSLDGGIISDILVQEGQLVQKGQLLIKINPIDSLGSFRENHLRYNELKARAIRLQAESLAKHLSISSNLPLEIIENIKKEQQLNRSNMARLSEQTKIFEEEQLQAKSSLKEARRKALQLERSYDVVKEKLKIIDPLLKKAIVSQVEYLDLKQQEIKIKGDLDNINLSIPRLKSVIKANKRKIKKTILDFKIKAQEEYTKISAQIDRLKELDQVLENKVNRTELHSPVKGTVNRMMIKTVGGVIRPGMDIIEIIPLEDKLYIETKIKPSDIAYIFPGQKANVKFTAYDFTIFGGLLGTVVDVSADTIKDENGENFYIVKIQTDKNHLTRGDKKFNLIVGMVAQVDIMTGKKTVMNYLVKPLIKAKEKSLTER